jgi:hypothetical protein
MAAVDVEDPLVTAFIYSCQSRFCSSRSRPWACFQNEKKSGQMLSIFRIIYWWPQMREAQNLVEVRSRRHPGFGGVRSVSPRSSKGRTPATPKVVCVEGLAQGTPSGRLLDRVLGTSAFFTPMGNHIIRGEGLERDSTL